MRLLRDNLTGITPHDHSAIIPRSPHNYPNPHKNRIQVTGSEGPQLLRSVNSTPKLHCLPKGYEYRGLCDGLGFSADEHLTAFDLVRKLQSFRREEHTALQKFQ